MSRLLRFNVSTGPVELHFPPEMTADDVQDFEDTIAILIRSLRRWHASAPEPDEPDGALTQ